MRELGIAPDETADFGWEAAENQPWSGLHVSRMLGIKAGDNWVSKVQARKYGVFRMQFYTFRLSLSIAGNYIFTYLRPSLVQAPRIGRQLHQGDPRGRPRCGDAGVA